MPPAARIENDATAGITDHQGEYMAWNYVPGDHRQPYRHTTQSFPYTDTATERGL